MIEPDVRGFDGAWSDPAVAGSPEFLPPAPPPAPAPEPQGGSTTVRRRRRPSLFRGVQRLWVPLVIIAVVAAGGFTVSRLHGIFGSDKHISYGDTRTTDSKPFNPKHVTYEVFGAPGTLADISYFDGNGDPQRVIGARLPWTFEYAISAATAVGNVMAQGNSDSIGCRISVDDVVKSEKTMHETSAFTSCLLKSE